MKKKNKCFLIIGSCLLGAAMIILISWQWNIRNSELKTEHYVETLYNLMPVPQGAVVGERNDNRMPILSVDGIDFVGVLEVPRYGSILPVCAKWGRLTKYPCRFGGSIYDGTMQIGATNQKGQYDFYGEITVGDNILFTDVEGNRYAYVVTNLRYEKHADQATLEFEESALTLFIKNVYDTEYQIVSCDVAY